MSISFYGYVFNSIENVWEFPAAARNKMDSELPKPDHMSFDDWCMADPEINPEYDGRLDVNLSEANAREVIRLLGFVVDCEEIPTVEQFINRVANVRQKRLDKQSPAIDVSVSNPLTGPVVIDCGRGEGYVEIVLERLSVLAHAFKEHGASNIGWG